MPGERPSLCDDCPLLGQASGRIARFLWGAARRNGEVQQVAGMAVNEALGCSKAFRLDSGIIEALKDGPQVIEDRVRSCQGPVKLGLGEDDSVCLALGVPDVDPGLEQAMRQRIQDELRPFSFGKN